MPDLFPFQIESIQAFLMALTRVSATLAFLPVLGGQAIPNTVKIGLATFITVILFPLMETSHIRVDGDFYYIALMIMGEAMIGVMTAFFVNLVFAGVQLAGSIIGFQIGFGIVNVVDPVSGAQVSLTSQFYNIVTMLLFVTLNVHHMLLIGLAGSFHTIPLGGFTMNDGMLDFMLKTFGTVYITGLQIAAPLTIMLLLKQAAMGLIARTIPQMNIFIVGFPLTIAFGLMTMAISLPTLTIYIGKLFTRMISQLDPAFQLMGPSGVM